MKKQVSLICIFILMTTIGYAQQSRITISGGYAFANIVDTEVSGTGWRINGLYEFNPFEGKLAHGLSFGYVSLSAEGDEGLGKSTYKISTFPIYYAPKFLFGSENFKGYLKAAMGLQFSGFNREGALGTLEMNDSGILLGAGIGGEYRFTKSLFMNAEYEWIWMTNSYYRNNFLSTLALGLGIRL